jgi:septum formation protein
MATVYLASRSPRRRQLLRQIGVRCTLLLLRQSPPRGPDVDETPHDSEVVADFALRVAVAKARFGAALLVARRLPRGAVLAADTVVSIDGGILGQPADRDEAASYLRRLSGRSHEVRTAVALTVGRSDEAEVLTAVSVSTVRFAALSERQIERYCAGPEPYDKAGGYAIQGVAATFIEHLDGSYSGVMGLPLFETAQLLRQGGIAELP